MLLNIFEWIFILLSIVYGSSFVAKIIWKQNVDAIHTWMMGLAITGLIVCRFYLR